MERKKPQRPSRPIHFLHIGKTGGSAIKAALEQFPPPSGARLHKHRFRLHHVPSGEAVFFIVRDPVTRYVSSFNSRLRQGKPRRDYPWRPKERTAFERYRTPTALAEDLYAESAESRKSAKVAMRSIGHIKTSYYDWIISDEYFLSRMNDIIFIGIQEDLSADFERLKKILDLPAQARLPEDEVVSHRMPADLDRSLSDRAVANLRRWYAADCRFYDLCKRLRAERWGL